VGLTQADPSEDDPEDRDDADSSPPIVEDPDPHLRAWLRTIKPILELRAVEPDISPRVQFAYDQMIIAACERIGRICRSDLPEIPTQE
jgi:hypothetical protein